MVTQAKRNTESPVSSGNKRNLMETMLSPLVAVYGLLSGPPLTDRERSLRAGIDANVRRSVSVYPYHLTHQK